VNTGSQIPQSNSHREPVLRTYRLFGLTVASELVLDDVEAGEGDPDAIIRFGATPERLEAPTAGGQSWQASPGQILVTVAGIGRLHIRGGCEVVVTPEVGATADDLAYAVLRAAISSLLHQRQILVLHASAVRQPDGGGAIAVAGASTSGKSTVLFTCLQRGWEMVTDDIAALDIPPAGQVRIWSGNPVINLWRDALDHFAVDAGRLPALRSGVDKFKWRAPEPLSCTAPLSAVVVLTCSPLPGIRCERLQGARAFAALRANVRGLQIAASQHQPGTFMRLANAADRLSVFSICRPASDLNAAPVIVDLVDAIAANPQRFGEPIECEMG